MQGILLPELKMIYLSTEFLILSSYFTALLRSSMIRACFLALMFADPGTAEILTLRRWKASPVVLQSVEYSPDGQHLLTASGGGIAQIWSTNGDAGPEFKGQRPPMFRAHFNFNGQKLITTGYDGTAWIWSANGKRLRTLQLHRAATAEVQFLPPIDTEGPGYVSGSDDGSVVLTSSTGKPLWIGQFIGTTRQVIGNRDASLIIAGTDDGGLHFIQPSISRTTAVVNSYQTSHGRINRLEFSPDQSQIAVSGRDGFVSIWTLSGSQIKRLKASNLGPSRGGVYCSSMSQTLLTIGDDGVVRQWSMSGNLLNSHKLSSDIKLTGIDCSPSASEAAVVDSKGQAWILSISPNHQ